MNALYCLPLAFKINSRSTTSLFTKVLYFDFTYSKLTSILGNILVCFSFEVSK